MFLKAPGKTNLLKIRLCNHVCVFGVHVTPCQTIDSKSFFVAFSGSFQAKIGIF